jgi:hypothetical protein
MAEWHIAFCGGVKRKKRAIGACGPLGAVLAPVVARMPNSLQNPPDDHRERPRREKRPATN